MNFLRRTPALLALAATVGSAMYSGFPSAGDVILKPTTAAITAAGSPNAMSAPGVRTVSLFLAASDLLREGFVRVINRSDQASEVTVGAPVDTRRRREDGLGGGVGVRRGMSARPTATCCPPPCPGGAASCPRPSKFRCH